MSVLAFNHFNIRAPRPLLEEVKQFYLEVIGLTEGYRPDVPIHGHWLYLEDLPVLHLMEWRDIAKAPTFEKGVSRSRRILVRRVGELHYQA